MNSLVERVEAHISERHLLEDDERVLVGLSGGADSIALAHVLLELGYTLHAVHINFQLRGEASDGDEDFVRRWCEERALDLTVQSYVTTRIAEERGLSVQHAARELRYTSFAACAREAGISTVAVGHHRDDQAETVLLNLFRGTGLEGLAGMPVKRSLAGVVTLVRPLLIASKDEIVAYARANDLRWREDASNTKTIYRRGALRTEILPLVERYFGAAALKNVAHAADLVRSYLESSLEGDLRAAFERSADAVDGHGALRLDPLTDLSPVIRKRVVIEALRRWLPDVEASSNTAEEIEGLLTSQPGRRREYGGGEVWRERDRLLFIAPPFDSETPPPVVLEEGGTAKLPSGTMRADILPRPPEHLDADDPNTAFLDAKAVSFPLYVRQWEEGDRFSPLGMTQSKKLSDFLTDEQVSPYKKAGALVVESDGRIVWVVRHRIGHGARVTDETAETVRLSFHPTENRG